MIWAAAIVELICLIEMRRRIKIINPAELACWFILASQIVYVNGDLFFYTEQPWPSYSYLHHPNPAILLYSSMFMIFYSSTWAVGFSGSLSLKEKLSAAALKALAYNGIALAAVYGIVGAYLLTVNYHILWYNTEYLKLSAPDASRLSESLGGLIRRAFVLSGTFSAFFFSINLMARKRGPAALWLVVLSITVAIILAGCSRTAFLLIMISFLVLVTLSRFSRLLLVAVYAPLAATALNAALNARNQGEYGISALPFIISTAYVNGLDLQQVTSNLFQGVFITADGLDVKTHFSSRYRFLSFSPLPSLIDKFDTIRESDEIRLYYFTPMSALTESIKFGIAYYLLLMGTFWFAFRLMLGNARKLGGVYALVAVGSFATFVAAGAYPVRNVYKQLLVWILLTLVVAYLAGRRQRAAARAAGRLSQPADRRSRAGIRDTSAPKRFGRAGSSDPI